MNDHIALSLKNISFEHDKGKALHDITLDIQIRKTTVILGPNGAGKSIFLKLCHGLLQPTTGHIISRDNYTKSAMVFAKPTVLRRSVLKNITYILDIMAVHKNDQETIALQALKEYSMDKFSHIQAKKLSSGEKQRLSLIRAQLLKPNILYLDEPTANLDPRATAFLENMIVKNYDNQTTIVMATHDLMQAKRIAQEIIYIENGSIIETAKAGDFFNNPKSDQARNFIQGKL